MIRSVLFYAVLGLDELHEPTATGFSGHFVHCLCAVKRSPVRFTAMYDASHSTTDLISEITAFMFDSSPKEKHRCASENANTISLTCTSVYFKISRLRASLSVIIPSTAITLSSINIESGLLPILSLYLVISL